MKAIDGQVKLAVTSVVERPRAVPQVILAAAVVVLGLSGVLPRWPGILHEVAVPPLDLIADVRVLTAQANGYLLFVLGLILALAVRTAVLAAVLEPLGGARPRRQIVWLCLRLYLVALPLAIVAGAAQFTAAAALYHWYFWMGLAVAIVSFLLLAAAPVRAAGEGGEGKPSLGAGMAASARHGFDVRILVPYLISLALLGGVARLTGRWGSVLLVPVSLLLTRWTMVRLAERRRSALLGVALSLAVVLALISLGLTDSLAEGASPRPNAFEQAELFVVPGVDTSSGQGAMFRLNPRLLGFGCARVTYFSYRGLGSGAPQGQSECPIRSGAPYQRLDTQRPLSQLVTLFTQEAHQAREESGLRPLVVITHSQGAWIAWKAIASGMVPDVRAIIMLGAFPDVSVDYPPRGRDGPGRVGGDADRFISSLVRAGGISTFSPDATLAHQLLGTRDAVRALFARRPPPSVKAVAVFSDFDLTVAPQGWTVPGVPTATVAATHASLPRSGEMARAVYRLLDDDASTEDRLCRAMWPLLPAFGVPPWDT